MEAAPAVGGAAGGSTEAEFDENDGEDLVPVLSSVLNALVQRDDKVCARPLWSFQTLTSTREVNAPLVVGLSADGTSDDVYHIPRTEATSYQHSQISDADLPVREL
jgi:hypothetical protein